MDTVLSFDGSFEGFLSAVFEGYALKLLGADIVNQHRYVPSFLQTVIDCPTDPAKAARVMTKLQALCSKKELNEILSAFLSENDQVYSSLYRLIQQKIKRPKQAMLSNLGDPDALLVSNLIQKVRRERHRMCAFVRFEHGDDDLYFAKIIPDFDVLPLIAQFFRRRFAKQNWLIFDAHRHYGIYYNGAEAKPSLEMIVDIDQKMIHAPKVFHSDIESKYQKLWQVYFKHVSIEERKNIRHHVQQLPKRYWRFLTEKQGIEIP